MKGEKYKVIKKCKNVNYCKLESEEKMNELEKINETIFENIKHVDDEGNEYWYARELQQILGYKEWRYFSAVIEKA